MKLLELSYKDENWELSNLQLGNVNLIVGENSTGKSRTLSMIDSLYKMITQKRDLSWGEEWDIKFENTGEEIINYKFRTSLKDSKYKGVAFEEITINEKSVLRRESPNKATITSDLTGNQIEVYPPQDKLVLHVRRDVKEYPFWEEIISWAKQSYGFKFSSIMPNSKLPYQAYGLLTTIEDTPMLFEALDKDSRSRIIEEFNTIGYQVLDISLQQRGGEPVLYIKEENLSQALPHYELSQGMFRSLSILIYLAYLISRKKTATIMIDDLCEGLDYAKATKLGKIIFKKCDNSQIQLIATSNDSFLMDVVDIKHWNVLYREGKSVHTLNYKTQYNVFEQFKFTGLSNFDFFASDYLKQKAGL